MSERARSRGVERGEPCNEDGDWEAPLLDGEWGRGQHESHVKQYVML